MLIFRKEAKQDIETTYEWYEKQQPGLGKAFVSELEQIIQKIELNPKMYAIALNQVRRVLCRRFPYSLYFLISDDDIVIIGVLHQRRNPVTWKIRE